MKRSAKRRRVIEVLEEETEEERLFRWTLRSLRTNGGADVARFAAWLGLDLSPSEVIDWLHDIVDAALAATHPRLKEIERKESS